METEHSVVPKTGKTVGIDLGIKDFVIQQYGLFDENLTPAYSEDADYILECAENDNVELPIIWQQYKENQLNSLNENTKEDYDETA